MHMSQSGFKANVSWTIPLRQEPVTNTLSDFVHSCLKAFTLAVSWNALPSGSFLHSGPDSNVIFSDTTLLFYSLHSTYTL